MRIDGARNANHDIVQLLRQRTGVRQESRNQSCHLRENRCIFTVLGGLFTCGNDLFLGTGNTGQNFCAAKVDADNPPIAEAAARDPVTPPSVFAGAFGG